MSQGDRPGTLVDYVTGQMERRHPGDLQTVFSPGGEFEILTSAARHKVPDLSDELRKFRSQAEQLCSKLENLGLADVSVSGTSEGLGSMPPELDVLPGRGHLLRIRIEELERLEAELKQLEEKYEEIVIWFHMEDRGTRKPMDEFFHIWDKFLRDVQVAHKAFEQQELKEKRKSSMPPRRATMHVPREKPHNDRLRSLTPRRSLKDPGSFGPTPKHEREDAPSSTFPKPRPRFSSQTELQREYRSGQLVEDVDADILGQQTRPLECLDAAHPSAAQQMPVEGGAV